MIVGPRFDMDHALFQNRNTLHDRAPISTHVGGQVDRATQVFQLIADTMQLQRIDGDMRRSLVCVFGRRRKEVVIFRDLMTDCFIRSAVPL